MERRPTWDITLDHLEVMGLLMLLYLAQDEDGLSVPQVTAMEKLEKANRVLLNISRLAP